MAIYDHGLSRNQRRKLQRTLDAMSHPKRQAFIAHTKLVQDGRLGLRARLCHYYLDRQLGVTRRTAWKQSGEWIKFTESAQHHGQREQYLR